MVKYILLVLFISQLYCDDLKYLKRTVVDETDFESASNIINNPTDNGSQTVAIGFNFPYNGDTFNYIAISSNGALRLKKSSTVSSDDDFKADNQELPYKNNSLYPYWYDLKPNFGGEIRYENKGNKFIISWEDIPDNNMMMIQEYTFQVVLYKSGDIRFRYDKNSSAGKKCMMMFIGWMCSDGATIGVEELANRYDQYSYKTVIDQEKDVLYLPIRSVSKDSCVIKDPINGTNHPKRIPSATIRYAIEVRNFSSSDMSDVIVEDRISTIFDRKSIKYLQIQNGSCDCLGVSSANNNGSNGSSDGVNPIKLDFGTVVANNIECGYFEVDIK